MFYTEFDGLVDDNFKDLNPYPSKHKSAIDDQNKWVYETVNNGVYRAGFASTQEAYEEAVTQLFEVNIHPLTESLDKLEDLLANGSGPYLLGEELTEADIRLYPTIVRFDPCYVQHFKVE